MKKNLIFMILISSILSSTSFSEGMTIYPVPIIPPTIELKLNDISVSRYHLTGEDIKLELVYSNNSLVSDEDFQKLADDPKSISFTLPDGFSIKNIDFLKEGHKIQFIVGTALKNGYYVIRAATNVPKDLNAEYGFYLYSESEKELGFDPSEINENYYRNPVVAGGLNLIPFPVGFGYLYIDEWSIFKKDQPPNFYRSLAIRVAPPLLSVIFIPSYILPVACASILYDTYDCVNLTQKKNKYADENHVIPQGGN